MFHTSRGATAQSGIDQYLLNLLPEIGRVSYATLLGKCHEEGLDIA